MRRHLHLVHICPGRRCREVQVSNLPHVEEDCFVGQVMPSSHIIPARGYRPPKGTTPNYEGGPNESRNRLGRSFGILCPFQDHIFLRTVHQNGITFEEGPSEQRV